MFFFSKPLFAVMTITLLGTSLTKGSHTPSEGPEYAGDTQLKLPENYREWVYLTSDYYSVSNHARMQTAGQGTFNNIFVNPGAYQTFLRTGTWPDKTMLIVDERKADGMEPANPDQMQAVQSSQISLAVHVKDEARFPGKWAFFSFSNGTHTGKMIPATAGCYSCHSARGAEDTTFVQFYPTLLAIAKSKNTLDAAYLGEHKTRPSTTE